MRPGTVKRIFGVNNPKVSVIIPTLKDEQGLRELLEGLRKQTMESKEVILAYRFSPSGKARNKGAEIARGECLVFMDDDIKLGHNRILENLYNLLLQDRNIGLAGASTLLPPDANRFQKMVGKQIPRMVYPIVDKITESDMVTTQCWAQRRDNFELIGPFSEEIERGVDPEYRQRVRRAGFQIVIAPNTYTYHPPPKNFTSFIRQSFRNGFASALAQKMHPELIAPVPDSGVLKDQAVAGILKRIVKSFLQAIFSLVKLNLLLFLERVTYSLGYFWGKFIKKG